MGKNIGKIILRSTDTDCIPPLPSATGGQDNDCIQEASAKTHEDVIASSEETGGQDLDCSQAGHSAMELFSNYSSEVNGGQELHSIPAQHSAHSAMTHEDLFYSEGNRYI
jgi:hypothetical protein